MPNVERAFGQGSLSLQDVKGQGALADVTLSIWHSARMSR